MVKETDSLEFDQRAGRAAGNGHGYWRMQLPYVGDGRGRENAKCLLDTGAEVSLISEAEVARLTACESSKGRGVTAVLAWREDGRAPRRDYARAAIGS